MISEQDWREERAYLEHVRRLVEQLIDRIETTAQQQRKSVLEERRYVWENVTHDSSTPEAAAIQALHLTGLVDEEREYLVYRQVIEKYRRIAASPYFGRMDFREAGADKPERIYIGISSLRRPDDETPVVYDWRAPISSMYYDYGPGPASYESPVGPVQGEITLKRQFQIIDGELKGMFDTDVRIGDDILQSMLARHADDRMTSIVTSIQREQNQAIRNVSHRLFIVQGPAGSGKTSIALQRVAYLLYRLRGRLTSDHILLMTPNRIFEDYVSNVLPELGESNMRQATFLDHVRDVLRPPIQFEDFYSHMERWLTGRLRGTEARAAEIKMSHAFAEVVKRYLDYLAEHGLPFPDVVYKGRVIFSGKDMGALFCGEFRRYRIAARLWHLRRRIEERIRELEEYNRKRYEEQLFAKTTYVGTDDEIREMARTQSRRHADRIRAAVRRLWRRLPLLAYRALFTEPGLLESLAPESLSRVDLEALREHTSSVLAEVLAKDEAGPDEPMPRLPYEDSIPLAYLYAYILGPARREDIRHVLIDEAQDYTRLQYETLAVLFPQAAFTILGDTNQSVHPYVPVDCLLEAAEWMKPQLSAPRSSAVARLTKSYRSTAEILRFAGAVLPGEAETATAIRQGHERPRVVAVPTQADHAAALIAEIERLKAADMRSIGVICRTDAEAEAVWPVVSAGFQSRRVRSTDEQFQTGIVVIPSYLAKGLEYDAVVVVDGGAYQSEERRLFYTVCTRALHRLTVLVRGEAPLIAEIPEELFERVEASC